MMRKPRSSSPALSHCRPTVTLSLRRGLALPGWPRGGTPSRCTRSPHRPHLRMVHLSWGQEPLRVTATHTIPIPWGPKSLLPTLGFSLQNDKPEITGAALMRREAK